MSDIENVQIPEAEQVKMPEEQQKLERVDRALTLGSGIIKKWLKDKRGIEFTVEQEAEFDHMYQASFALSSLAM